MLSRGQLSDARQPATDCYHKHVYPNGYSDGSTGCQVCRHWNRSGRCEEGERLLAIQEEQRDLLNFEVTLLASRE